MEAGTVASGRLNDVLTTINTLPTPTRVYDLVSTMLTKPSVSAKEVAQVVSADQAITARLLKLVNSPFYGFPEKIPTVSRAITIIGFEALRNLVLASSLMDLFTSKHKQRAYFNLDRLWVHSLAVGVAAGAIAKRVEHADSEEYLVAGLMHDIGKAVLLSYFPEHVDAIVDVVRRQNCLFLTAERRVLGTDHSSIGKVVAEQWRLPAVLCDGIAMHHRPLEAAEPLQAAAVHLADIIARSLLLGSGGDQKMPRLDVEAYKLLGLDDDKLHDVMRQVERIMAAERLSSLAGEEN